MATINLKEKPGMEGGEVLEDCLDLKDSPLEQKNRDLGHWP